MLLRSLSTPLGRRLAPALAALTIGLALASPATAGSRTVRGTNGAAGAPGTTAADGADGADGQGLVETELDAGTLTVTGGAGGVGGRGGNGDATSPDAGDGGNGGDGGTVDATATRHAEGRVITNATGGRGGNGGEPGSPAAGGLAGVQGTPGDGGDATATAIGDVPVAPPVGEDGMGLVFAGATGGTGGNGSNPGGIGGAAGQAHAEARGSVSAGGVHVTISQRGGHGGDGDSGAQGADSIARNHVSGSAPVLLDLGQNATGGSGGDAVGSGRAGDGGRAESVLDPSHAWNPIGGVHAGVGAAGGMGGGAHSPDGQSGAGGAAHAAVEAEAAGDVSVTAFALSGRGGFGWIGAEGTRSSLGPVIARSTAGGSVSAGATLGGGSGGDGIVRSGSGLGERLENAVQAITSGPSADVRLAQTVSGGASGSRADFTDAPGILTEIGSAGSGTSILDVLQSIGARLFVDSQGSGGGGGSNRGVGAIAGDGAAGHGVARGENAVGSSLVTANANGGAGGLGAAGAAGGRGGDARAESSSSTHVKTYYTEAQAFAAGGSGGGFLGFDRFGGTGGDAESVAEARAAAETHLVARAEAKAGRGGRFDFSPGDPGDPFQSGQGGDGGNAFAKAFGENRGLGSIPVIVDAIATAGAGNRGNGEAFSGGSGGDARAESEARSVNQAVFVTSTASGGGGDETSSRLGGGGDGGDATASTLGISETGLVDAQASANAPIGQREGLAGQGAAQAEARSGGTIAARARANRVTANVSIADDLAVGGSKTGFASAIQGTNAALPTLVSLASHSVAAVSRLAPTEADVATLSAGNPNTAQVFGPAGTGQAFGLGMLSATLPTDARAVDIVLETEIDFGYTPVAGDQVLIALTDPTSIGSDPEVSAMLEILANGVVVARTRFGSDPEADATLDDQIFKLVFVGGNINLGIRMTTTTGTPGAGFQLGLIWGTGDFAGATPIPEPGTALLVGVGVALLACRRGNVKYRG